MNEISKGLSVPCLLLIYVPGSNIGNLHFLWRVSDSLEPTAHFESSQSVIEEIRKQLPTYHTRAMKKSMFEKFGCIPPSVKPSVLRYFYKSLTGEFYVHVY